MTNEIPAPLTDDDFELPKDVDMSNPLISGADPSKGKIYDKLRLEGGTYWFRVEEMSSTKHPQFGFMLRVTGKIIHVVQGQDFIAKSEPPQPCQTLMPGQSPTRMIKENQYGHGAQEMNSLLTALGLSEKQINPKTVGLYFSSQTPAMGKVVEVDAQTTVSDAGRRFARVAWRRIISDQEIANTLTTDQLEVVGMGHLVNSVEGD